MKRRKERGNSQDNIGEEGRREEDKEEEEGME